MDFKLFFAVVKRYKRMVIAGVVVGVVLAVLSYGMPSLKGGMPTVVPRGAEVWEGEAQVLISQAGFPYGRAVTQVVPGKGTSIPAQPLGDVSYMSNLSSIYAALANGSDVQRAVAKATHIALCPLTIGPIGTATPTPGPVPCSSVVAAPLAQPGTGVPLPLLTLTSSAPTATQAAKLATTTVAVLRNEIARQQAASGTSVDQRVQLQTVNTGATATLTQGPSKSVPMLVLFAIVAATIALAFMRNNNSDDPVRSTRRRLDEGLDGDGSLGIAARNGHVAEPDHGLARTGGARMKLIGLRRDASGIQLADEENATTQRAAAEGSSATDGRRAWSDRSPHILRGSRSEAESRD
ncbi:MAG TPA: hypothetical protein VFH80_04700 [Solirubrobacteraceae bacterium]|nr:hypothetical protein [Solirubrobacteraceae bacterium]